MRRVNRSIDTFDISLMAVVTKAMGAFLVLMLILLPYYSPDPMSRQAVEQLAENMAKIRARIEEVARAIGEVNPNSPSRKDLEAALEDMLNATEQLRQLQGLLNEARAEIQRLEQENANRRKEIAELEEQLRKTSEELAAHRGTSVIATFNGRGCDDVILEARIVRRGDGEGLVTSGEERRSVKPEWTLHYQPLERDGVLSAKMGTEPWAWAPAITPDFNSYAPISTSFLATRFDLTPGEYLVVVTKRHRTETVRFLDNDLLTLTRSSAPCALTMGLWIKEANRWNSWFSNSLVMDANAYGGAVMQLIYQGEGSFSASDPVGETAAWFTGLLNKAVQAQDGAGTKRASESPAQAPAKPPDPRRSDGNLTGPGASSGGPGDMWDWGLFR